MLGRLVPEKRQWETVQAFAKLISKNTNINTVLSIFGGPLEGHYFNRISAFVEKLPREIKERIIFQGQQPSIEAIAGGDIFVGPSSWESWYLALVEAIACGKPAITTNTAVLCEATQNAAFYIDVRGPIIESLIFAMEKLSLDQKFYQSLKSKAKIDPKDYDWEQSARGILKAIAKL